MPTISIIANCQGAPLAHILPYISGAKVAEVFVAHELGVEDEDRVCERLRKADIVFAQPFMSGFPLKSLRAENISRTLGRKVILAPNLHFEAPFGEPTNIRTLAGFQLADVPTRSYHFKPIVEAYYHGRDVSRAVDYLTDPLWYSHSQASALLDESFSNIQFRERFCDVKMSDTIADMLAFKPLFFTTNHPVDTLLYLLAEKILFEASIPFSGLNPDFFGTSRVRRALGDIALPANPSIAYRLGFKYSADLIYKGISNDFNVVEETTYSPRSLVDTFFATYDAHREYLEDRDVTLSSLRRRSADFRVD